ncbi:hypothetical protein B0H13DRAFT_1896286 [Mycena leptocephala]|nr:hypothetical protein B0H13DRAFT_1896286 [Mycena leptocephala]
MGQSKVQGESGDYMVRCQAVQTPPGPESFRAEYFKAPRFPRSKYQHSCISSSQAHHSKAGRVGSDEWLLAKLHTVARSLTDDEAIGLLPVFYANLDLSWIRSLDVLDIIADLSTRLSCIVNATKTFSSLCYITRNPLFPLLAAPDLWPQIWKWMEFLRLYYESVPALPASEGVHACIAISNSPEIQPASPNLPGNVFDKRGPTYARNSLGNPGAPHSYSGRTSDVIASPLLALSDMEDPQNLAEVVDGCGGSYKALALTLMKNISQAVANSKSEMTVTSITPVLCFLSDVSRISPNLSRTSSRTESSPLWSASGRPTPPYHHFECKNGHSIGRGKYPELLGTVLPRTLVFYPIFAEMKKSFSELETLSGSEEFSRSVLYGHWRVLKALVDERVKVSDSWEASGRASSLACYNIEYDQVDAAYCLRECQRADWIDGHRDECHILLSAHLSLSSLWFLKEISDQNSAYAEIGLYYREKSFNRTLLHSDYQRLRFVISIHMLKYMTENPGTSFFVAFDSTRATGVELPINADSSLGAPCARGVRLTLHAIRIGHGANWSNAMFPLRATSSQFSDGLARIASRLNGLQYSQVEALVRDLIETTDKENTEIH